MVTKKVKVHQNDANEATKLQIITAVENGVILFGAHPKPEERVKIPNGTKLEVLDPPIHGAGASNPMYYYITDNASNGNFRRYYIKVEDTAAA
jgi:hypothetical protein